MPKRKLTLWVSEETNHQVRDLAAMHGLTLSEVASSYLERAMRAKAETLGVEIVVPAVEGTVRREMNRMVTRLSRLLARSALEAAASRRLGFNTLLQQGVSPQDAKAINESAWRRSVESLRKPLAELEEIVQAHAIGASPGGETDHAANGRESELRPGG